MAHFYISEVRSSELIEDAREVRRIAARQLRWAANAEDKTHADLIAREAATMLDLAVKVEELFGTT